MTLALTDETGRYRLTGVDVLRGLSVLLVTLHHIHLRFWINDYTSMACYQKHSTRYCSGSGTMRRLFALTTEPSGRGNPDTEDPLSRPARPWYSRGSVCFPRYSDALGALPYPFAPSREP
jgi:hypothetical protein